MFKTFYSSSKLIGVGLLVVVVSVIMFTNNKRDQQPSQAPAQQPIQAPAQQPIQAPVRQPIQAPAQQPQPTATAEQWKPEYLRSGGNETELLPEIATFLKNHTEFGVPFSAKAVPNWAHGMRQLVYSQAGDIGYALLYYEKNGSVLSVHSVAFGTEGWSLRELVWGEYDKVADVPDKPDKPSTDTEVIKSKLDGDTKAQAERARTIERRKAKRTARSTK